MSTTVLDLNTDFFKLLAVMLRPDDPEPLREDLTAKMIIDSEFELDEMDQEFARQLLTRTTQRHMRGETPLEGQDNGGAGAITGDVLMFLMQMVHAGIKEPSLKKARWLTSDYAKGAVHDGSPKVGYSDAAIKGYWRQFRCVAHLWAALRVIQFQHDDPRDAESIGAAIMDDMPNFLAIAKRFQNFADDFTPTRERNPTPILPADAWRIAETIAISNVTPPPLETWVKQALDRYTHI